MNVIDDEIGPICEQEEAERLATLAQAGLTLEQFRAYEKITRTEGLAN